MARIGTLKVAGSNGVYDIGIFEVGDLEYEPLRVACENGIGVLPLTDPPDADTPIRVMTDARGVQAINTTQLFQSVDDFEHGDLQSYYGIADNRNVPEARAEAAHSGDWGWYGYSDTRSMSLPQSHPNHNPSEQPNFLDHYPTRGDTFEFYINVREYLGGVAINRFHFGKQDYEEASNGYRIWWSFNDDYWRLERVVGGSSDTLVDNRGPSWPYREWIRGVVDWHSSGFDVSMYRANGDEIDTLSASGSAGDTTYDSGGVGYDNGENAVSWTDDWRILPESQT